MAFELKDYQRECLNGLGSYLRRVVELEDANTAFYERTRRTYHEVGALPGLPYVCLRVPTGGGKTVMAAHAVGVAARELLRQEKCIALWLAPTTQIVEQTLRGLQDRGHPCRMALDEAFGGCVTVMDIDGALYLNRGTLESDAVVIVSTMATMRVEDPTGRRIYAHNENLDGCFTGLQPEQIEILRQGANGFDGEAPSLANLLRAYRPVMIVDEAHNARTILSFDALARFNPSCIVEFTATPDENPKESPSNVLMQVSAAELKAEEMIKLPLRLKARAQWKEAVGEALAKQKELERLAKEEERETGEYVRPIVLFQAERHLRDKETITWEVLRQSLMDDFGVKEEEIKIATGARNDLGGLDVMRRGEETRFIITVDKLREGWDCSFAYILCSVTNLSSKTAVEQILGRVLRLPHAKLKKREALNQSYAFATSTGFVEAANHITEALVGSGFEKFEAQMFVKRELGGEFDFGPLFREGETQTIVEIVEGEPDLEGLPVKLREKIQVRTVGEVMEVVYTGGPLDEKESAALKGAVKGEKNTVAMERLCRKSRGEDAWPAALGEKIAVPMLGVRVDGQLDIFEDQFRETAWLLRECNAGLEEHEFRIESGPERAAEVDVTEQGKIQYKFVEELRKQLLFFDLRGPKTEAELVVWLDRAISHPDITHTESGLFLRRMVEHLVRERGISLEEVIRYRFRLRDAAEAKLAAHRIEAVGTSYQMFLDGEAEGELEVSPELCFEFPLNQYPAKRLYGGPVQFQKHYYEFPAEMNGEEAQCAVLLDGLPQVKYWVRNLVWDRYSFWLQTQTDKFYPDFVGLLTDGRYLVVEYKGEDRRSSDDAEEKNALGKIWEARSEGRCVFRMVTKGDMDEEIRGAVK